MSKIIQLGRPCSLCPLLATWLITCQYFPCKDCSPFLITTCFHFIWWHQVSHRHTKNSCDSMEDYYHFYSLILVAYVNVYCFLGKSHIFNGQARVGKILLLGGYCPHAPWLCSWFGLACIFFTSAAVFLFI